MFIYKTKNSNREVDTGNYMQLYNFVVEYKDYNTWTRREACAFGLLGLIVLSLFTYYSTLLQQPLVLQLALHLWVIDRNEWL
jgi:hypothetical protein